MRVLVVNCSYEPNRHTAGSLSGYSLGAAKLANWLRAQGHTVTEWQGDPGMFSVGYDLVCLSVVFSWHAPVAREIALRVKGHANVRVGGPGMDRLAGWWARETGLPKALKRGLVKRLDGQRGDYPATFASRGCPVGCSFCIVPVIEGLEQSLDWDFQPAPILCDNNLSALPVAFQEHIIRRYQEAGVVLKDANSGFEPRTFDEGTYRRWRGILKGPWRFAFDETSEEQYVRPMAAILKDVPPSRKRVYVLIGNEPIEACLERARKVLEWGCEPYCQPVMRLNVLSRDDLWIRHDWTKQKLKDVARYYNRYLWRSVPLQNYRPRQGEAAPFREVA